MRVHKMCAEDRMVEEKLILFAGRRGATLDFLGWGKAGVHTPLRPTADKAYGLWDCFK